MGSHAHYVAINTSPEIIKVTLIDMHLKITSLELTRMLSGDRDSITWSADEVCSVRKSMNN